MRRDYFTVDIHHDTDDGIPAIRIAYEGPPGELRDRLTTTAETTPEAGDIDVTFRRQAATNDGVLALTERMTGEFIFEVTAAVKDVERLVEAAQNGDTDGQYEVRVTDSDGKSLVYDKRTLLVYGHDGSLLREESLIPGSVEL